MALVGPTASGKSSLAFAVAGSIPGVEIVSVDSMSVYRGMDIGTAKPSAHERELVRHHLVDIVDPSEEFTLRRFQAEARAAISDIEARGGTALLVGGTGLYLQAIVDDLNLPGRWPKLAEELRRLAAAPGGTQALWLQLRERDPLAASRMNDTNTRRVVRALEVTLGSGMPFSSYGPGISSYGETRFEIVGIRFDPAVHNSRIAQRFAALMERGLLQEVRALACRPNGLSRTARQGLGYRELLAHVEDDAPLEQAVDDAIRRTKVFARRQWAWFRRDPRIRWLNPAQDLRAQLQICVENVAMTTQQATSLRAQEAG